MVGKIGSGGRKTGRITSLYRGWHFTVREKLRRERGGLSLDKCLDMCRAAKSSNKQAKEIGDAVKTEVNAVSGHQKCNGSTTRWVPVVQILEVLLLMVRNMRRDSVASVDIATQ